MASTTDALVLPARRGFIPPRTDVERLVQRRALDLARGFARSGQARASGFLSDREQTLAAAALQGQGERAFRFAGGWPGAERKRLLVGPQEEAEAVAALRLTALPRSEGGLDHPGCLGALLALGVERTALGDILVEDEGRAALVFCAAEKRELFTEELRAVGRLPVRAEPCELALAELFTPLARPPKTGTLSSLRLDAALAEMLGTSRGAAVSLIEAGRVEVNHIAETKSAAPVYEGDVFTVRGKGRWRLDSVRGKSKKDRFIITYFKY